MILRSYLGGKDEALPHFFLWFYTAGLQAQGYIR